MRKQMLVLLSLCLAMGGFGASLVHADGHLHKVKHIIIVMQENHSFDNYFGVLPYAMGTPYERGALRSGQSRVCRRPVVQAPSGNRSVPMPQLQPRR
jgi:phospholipase C